MNHVSYNRSLIVSILLAASFVSLLNQTLLIVALPSIMNEFSISPTEAQWVTTGFMLANGIMIPITAFLIEKFSSKSLLITAISIFGAGTLLGAITPHFWLLIVARIVQAIGAGMLMPLMQTVIFSIFPVERRGTAMGMSGLVIGFAPAIGPTLAGWIIDHFSWRSLFYTVLPFTLVVLVLAIFLMKNVTEQKERKLDILSVILSSIGWGGILYASSLVGTYGWGSLNVISSLIIGAFALVFFIRRQFKLKQPMLNFSVFQSKEFTLTTILSIVVFGLLIGIETILPIYVQNVQQGSALTSGAMLLPGAIITGAMSPISGKLFDRFGAKGLSIVGFGFTVLSAILYTFINQHTSVIVITVIFSIQMLGMSLLMMPLMTAGINALPQSLIAHGTAMHNTIRTVGASIFTALLVSVMSLGKSQQITNSDEIFQGIKLAFLVALIFSFVGLLLSFFLSQKKKTPMESVN
ncbi:MDR family MFS transporter [Ureibacillus thermosphaericus]|uniref:MDR family MFS transporter n=1 Tax=Ureibacillus thermosphaericus TaxID=51173 RepID=UPI0030C91A7D